MTGSSRQAREADDHAPGPEGTRVYHAIAAAQIDADVVKVVRRLRRFHHQAYLVGGCVRDLLLAARPKDFDVATSALPREVRRIFRNSRVIGRRFQLVHVLFRGAKVIEVATFRQAPVESTSDDLLIRDDNVFGTAADDAFRRDFTINALFYDLHSRELVDFVNGLADIEDRLVRSIGDPEVRLREDPVRMLRAIKFASRLDLTIEDELWSAICRYREDILRAAPPRLLEEIYRVFRPGRSVAAVRLLKAAGILELLFPELARWLDQADDGEDRLEQCEALLRCFDRVWAGRGETPPDAVILAILLWLPWQERLDWLSANTEGRVDVGRQVLDFLSGTHDRLKIPRRIQDRIRQVLVAQPRFEPMRRRRKPGALLQRSFFADALGLYEARVRADEGDLGRVQLWRERAGLDRLSDAPGAGKQPPKKRRRRRRRRKRRPAGSS